MNKSYNNLNSSPPRRGEVSELSAIGKWGGLMNNEQNDEMSPSFRSHDIRRGGLRKLATDDHSSTKDGNINLKH